MAVADRPDLLAVLQQAGVQLPERPGGKTLTLRCPFHTDRGRPNLAVWPEQGRWRCFRCDVGGDVFDFVGMLLYGTGWNARDPGMFKAVLQRLNLGQFPQQAPPPPARPRALDPVLVQVLDLAARVYHLALLGAAGQPIRARLLARGIDLAAVRRHQIGYAAPGALLSVLAGYPASAQHWAEMAGLFHDGREWLQGRIVFPDIQRGGAVRHMIGRAPEPAARLRYLSLPGLPKTIWGLAAVRRSRPVLLTESIMDAINLHQLGLQGVAVNGTGLAAGLVESLARLPHLAILPQNDAAGKAAVQKWAELLPGARVLDQMDWRQGAHGPPHKDLNELWQAAGRDEAARRLYAALDAAGFTVQPGVAAKR